MTYCLSSSSCAWFEWAITPARLLTAKSYNSLAQCRLRDKKKKTVFRLSSIREYRGIYFFADKVEIGNFQLNVVFSNNSESVETRCSREETRIFGGFRSKASGPNPEWPYYRLSYVIEKNGWDEWAGQRLHRRPPYGGGQK